MSMEIELNPVLELEEQNARRRGFTLTEIAIVLGIIGLILGAIWVAAAAVYNNQRLAHANTQILQLVQGIRGLYATSTNAAGMTAAQLITAGVVPNDMVSGAATLAGPWPSSVVTLANTGDNLGFQIQYTNVPQAACIQFLLNIAGSANHDPGLFLAAAPAAQGASATAATNVLQAAYAGGTVNVAGAQAGTANNFGGCTVNGNNIVTFGFGLKA